MEEYDVDHTEANVDAPAAAMEVIGQEELIEESEVDYAEASMESEAHSLQPLFLSYLMHPRIVSVRLRPDASQDSECEIKVGGSHQCFHVSDTSHYYRSCWREQSGIDHDEGNVDGVVHVLCPLVYLISNAAPHILHCRTEYYAKSCSLGKKTPECITQTSCLTLVKKSSSKTPLKNPSAVTNIRQILVTD
uniref:Uncharacterized protein n=1 Tax=Solanum lycopersicum TaxID=4081 RepID=K4CZ09_SOLLC